MLLVINADRAWCGISESLWPMLQHDMFHTGQNISYGLPINAAEVKFSSELGVTGISSPVVDCDGTVYIGGSDGCLYRVASDGSSECFFNTIDGAVKSTPVLSDTGILYVATTNGRLQAITIDGVQQWTMLLDQTLLSSPVIGPEEKIFVGSGPNDGTADGFLHCISADGKKLWEYQTGAVGYSSPAIDQFGNVYVASVEGLLYAFDGDGELLWSYKAGEGILSSPVIIGDDTIYITTSTSLIALDYSGIRKREPFIPKAVIFGEKTDSGFAAGPAVDQEGNIYIGGILGDIHSLDADGNERWSSMIKELSLTDPLPAPVIASPVLDRKGRVYVRSKNYVAAISGQDGALAGSLTITQEDSVNSPAVEASPALGSRRTLLIPYVDGSLYAVSPKQQVLCIAGSVTGDFIEKIKVTGTVLNETAEQYSVYLADEGTYTLQDLYPGTYIVAPVRKGVTFEPPSREVRLGFTDIDAVDFKATISGAVIAEAQATPTQIQNNAATPILLTVEVLHALGISHIASVKVDLTEIGGSASQDMRDDGANGDAAAGDGIYSLSTVVPANISIKFTGLLVTVTDTENKVVHGAIMLEVFNEVEDTGDRIQEYEMLYQPVVLCDPGPCDTGGNYFTIQYQYDGSSVTERLRTALRSNGEAVQQLVLQVFSPSNTTTVPDYERPIQQLTQKLRVSNAEPGIWRYKVINQGLGDVQYSLTTTAAGTGVISGSVTEVETGTPVDQVIISTTGGGYTQSQNGYYLMLSPAGVFTLTASDPLHAPASLSVNLTSGSAVEANILLLPKGSTDPGICPVEELFQGSDDVLQLARQFRDAVLPMTGYGTSSIAKYYRFAPEITACIGNDAALRDDIAAAMLGLLPVMEKMLKREPAFLNEQQLFSITQCLEHMQQHAGPALGHEIEQVLQDIGSGAFFNNLNLQRQFGQVAP